MKIIELELKNFRNFKEIKFNFDKTTVIWADNTRGKTNLLEAIFFISTGKSFRAEKEIDVISYSKPYFDIQAKISKEEESNELRIFGQREDDLFKKTIQINGINHRLSNFAGVLKAILFTPQDFDLVNGSPSVRRKYLDTILIQGDRDYAKSILKYKKIVMHKNRLLEKIRDRKARIIELDFWNQNLLILGRIIQEKRYQYLTYINSKLREYNFLHRDLKGISLIYKINVINEERLKNYQEKEIMAGMTLIGPHRDDFEILLNKRCVANFASRGEQRLTILSMALASLDFIEYFLMERPILLLDDIFSELDNYHRKMILEIFGKQQTILTTTEWENEGKIKDLEIIKLNEG